MKVECTDDGLLQLDFAEDSKEDQEMYAHLTLMAKKKNMTFEQVINDILGEALEDPSIMDAVVKSAKKDEKNGTNDTKK